MARPKKIPQLSPGQLKQIKESPKGALPAFLQGVRSYKEPSLSKSNAFIKNVRSKYTNKPF